MAKIYRQGDVVLTKVNTIPNDAVQISNELRVKGETGHEHILKGIVYEIPKTAEQEKINPLPMIKWIDVGNDGALITHTEENGHPDLFIPAGKYLARRIRTYTFNKIKEVVD